VQKKQIIIAVFALGMLAGILAFSPDSQDKKDSTGAGENNDAAINFTLKDLKNKDVSLADYSGKVVLVNFWAHWCPPCVKEIPDLVKLRNTYQDQGFEILGVVVPARMNEQQVRKMVNNFEMSYPVLWGTMEALNQFGSINAIPRSFVLNQEGKIVEDVEGMGSYAMFDGLIKKHLKN
jgi:thiol-disulfide isomerase/thioredoxin